MKIPHVKTLVNCSLADEDNARIHEIPVVSCNKAVARLNVPEFFVAKELGVSPLRSCKRCRGCKECSYRNVMVSREKELVIRLMEDQIKRDEVTWRVTTTYPWTEDVIIFNKQFGCKVVWRRDCSGIFCCPQTCVCPCFPT